MYKIWYYFNGQLLLLPCGKDKDYAIEALIAGINYRAFMEYVK